MSLTLLSINESPRKTKKLVASFKVDGKTIKTHFGQSGASDFTKHKDEDRKKRYIARHRKNEDWTVATSAGALSRFILWNKPTLKASIADYKKRFGL